MVVATMIVAGFVRRSSSPFGRKAATVRAAPIHGNRGVLDLKAINKLTALGKKPEAPAEPTTKVCPFCCSEIPIKAVKCAHCGSDQPKE